MDARAKQVDEAASAGSGRDDGGPPDEQLVAKCMAGDRRSFDELIKRYRDLAVNRVSVSLPSEKAETILPVLDRWAAIIRAVNG